ncbi:MAG: hypothetical protein QXT84_03115, partial [Candidatus Bathyarchaeia archaeon]
MPVDLVLTNGKVVTEQAVLTTSVVIDDGKIVGIGEATHYGKADKIVDVHGNFIVPGGIDPHTHIETYFMGAEVPETWREATIAAAIGGTTTCLDFAGLEKPVENDTLLDQVNRKLQRAKGLAAVDYSVKPMLRNAFYEDRESLSKIVDRLVEMGIPGFKVFLAYRELGIYTDDWRLLQV